MKYITLKDGVDFRTISKVMTRKNYRMNHASARNVLVVAFKKLFKHISEEIKIELTNQQIEQLFNNQQVQETLSELFWKAHRK